MCSYRGWDYTTYWNWGPLFWVKLGRCGDVSGAHSVETRSCHWSPEVFLENEEQQGGQKSGLELNIVAAAAAQTIDAPMLNVSLAKSVKWEVQKFLLEKNEITERHKKMIKVVVNIKLSPPRDSSNQLPSSPTEINNEQNNRCRRRTIRQSIYIIWMSFIVKVTDEMGGADDIVTIIIIYSRRLECMSD